jgi:hypothetical protein
MKPALFISFALMACLVMGCKEATPVCPIPSGTPQYLSVLPDTLPTPTPATGPYTVDFGKGELQVDKIVQGALCNDHWSGTVYVGCDVQVYPWTEQPTFLKDCKLTIEPQTVVYVAYHNNTAYYTGCSCHTGVTPEP